MFMINREENRDSKNITPLPKEKIKEKKKTWKERKERNKKIHLKNKKEYEAQRENLLKTNKGQFIAFSNGKILKISDSQDEVFKYIDVDPTVYVTQIGNEDVKPSLENILLTGDLYTENNGSFTCFPYHDSEQQIIEETDFSEISGYCGSKRPFISVILKSSRDDSSGIIATFLIDTQSPYSFVQPALIDAMNPDDIYGNMEGIHLFYALNTKLICNPVKVTKEDKRLEGINLLGSPFLRETGFFLPDENDKYKIKIQYGNVVSKKTANKIQYK